MKLTRVEAERHVLGAIIVDNNAFEHVSLDAEDFLVPDHRKIFKAMRWLRFNGEEVDLVSLRQHLLQSVAAPDIGMLVSLVEYVPPMDVAKIRELCDIIRAAQPQTRGQLVSFPLKGQAN